MVALAMAVGAKRHGIINRIWSAVGERDDMVHLEKRLIISV